MGPPYVYKKIKKLLPTGSIVNFYGRVSKIETHEEFDIVLLKDETSKIFVEVTSQPGHAKIQFRIGQIIRIHRSLIFMKDRERRARAPIGKSGCHIVIWERFGNPKSPSFKTSKNWTKSAEDADRVETLSNINEEEDGIEMTYSSYFDLQLNEHVQPGPSNAEIEIIEIEENEKEKEPLQEFIETLLTLTKGDEVKTDIHFPIDTSFFDEFHEVFLQMTKTCDSCYPNNKKAYYTRGNMGDCEFCQRRLTSRSNCRIRVDYKEMPIYFICPIVGIDEGEYRNTPALNADGTDNERLTSFRNIFKFKFRDAMITDVVGHVVNSSTTLNYCDVQLENYEVIYNK